MHKLPVLGASAEDELPSRRRFLALFTASAALATGAGCKPSRERGSIVPYTRKQPEVVPGVADHYASTFQEGELAYPVLVKAREGRPIHVEGNDEHPVYRGKTSPRAVADLLALYDPDRLRGPRLDGQATTWPAAIARLTSAVRETSGKSVVLVTGAVLSPSRRALLARLARAVPGFRHVEWEPAADHAARQAERELFGELRPRRYDFAKADVILSLEADFLGTLGDTVDAIAGFAARRRPATAAGADLNRLYVLEGGMSLTGSRADVRLAIRPSALARLAFGLVRALHLRTGRPLPSGMDPALLEPFALERLPEAKPFAGQLEALVRDLAAAGARALVLAGPAASPEAHVAGWLLNDLLGSIGSTLRPDDAATAPKLATSDDLRRLVEEMAAGRVGAALFWDANLAYDHAAGIDDEQGRAWRAAVAKVPLRVRLGLLPDETAAGCNLLLPSHHWLESWNDFEASGETLTLQQPVVAPLYETLQGEDVLLLWLAALGQPAAPTYLDFVKERWRTEVAPKESPAPFASFWSSCVHDGLFRRRVEPAAPRALDGGAAARAAERAATAPKAEAFELILDADPRLLDGRYANNGWLQELPDPVTRVSWDNPLAIAPADAERLRLSNGDLVRLGAGPALPVLRQPGQAPGVLRLTLGHGRWEGSVAAGVGTRAWAFAQAPGARVLAIASVERTGGRQPLALAQNHDTRDGRDIARAWTVADFTKRRHPEGHPPELPSLYPLPQERAPRSPRWGMAIDLSACVGCGACVVACQSENNVPVVGPEQVRKGRAMHWMRIDRYYEGDLAAPGVVHEPMLCQHCDNAPCETVCPVQATQHGPDGLNEMAYNRCVGTRYCANNCPYKVRRFNYLDFTSETPPSLQLAFNPEVSVRPRGVMEKCTFCVQRIRNADQLAKRAGRSSARDGEVTTACAAACPASAIVFGDLADPTSEVAKLSRGPRGFRVLEELGTRPAVTYLAQLKNPGARGKP